MIYKNALKFLEYIVTHIFSYVFTTRKNLSYFGEYI